MEKKSRYTRNNELFNNIKKLYRHTRQKQINKHRYERYDDRRFYVGRRFLSNKGNITWSRLEGYMLFEGSRGKKDIERDEKKNKNKTNRRYIYMDDRFMYRVATLIHMDGDDKQNYDIYAVFMWCLFIATRSEHRIF